MRSVLHLHAGYNKTGTTAIQEYLYQTDLGPDFTYFHNGVPNSSLLINQAFRQDIARAPLFRSENLTEAEVKQRRRGMRARIVELVSSIDTEHTILSAESIGQLEPDECEDLATFFLQFYREIRVYIYIRPLKSRLESAYQEILKTRFQSLRKRFNVSFERSVGALDAAFGIHNVRLFRFSRGAFGENGVVEHFLTRLGIPMTLTSMPQINTKLSLPAVQLLYCYRKYYPTLQPGDPERLNCLRALPGDSFHFHSKLYRRLLCSEPGDADWLERRAGFSLDENPSFHDRAAIRRERDMLRLPQESLDFLNKRQSLVLARRRLGLLNKEAVALAVNNLSGTSSHVS